MLLLVVVVFLFPSPHRRVLCLGQTSRAGGFGPPVSTGGRAGRGFCMGKSSRSFEQGGFLL